MQLHGNDLVASLGTGRYVEPPFARTREIPRGPVRVIVSLATRTISTAAMATNKSRRTFLTQR